MTASRGALAASWGPISDNEYTDGVYASYARRGIEFGPPERVAGTARGHHVDGAPQIAFAPGSGQPWVAALEAGRASRSFIVARR
jgi:hypothetical protein